MLPALPVCTDQHCHRFYHTFAFIACEAAGFMVYNFTNCVEITEFSAAFILTFTNSCQGSMITCYCLQIRSLERQLEDVVSREQYETDLGMREAEIRRLNAIVSSNGAMNTSRSERTSVSRSMSFDRGVDEARRLQEVRCARMLVCCVAVPAGTLSFLPIDKYSAFFTSVCAKRTCARQARPLSACTTH